MERQVDKAVGVAHVHLHPVELCVHVYRHALRQNLHFLIAWLNRAAVTLIVEFLLKEVRETLL